MLPYFLIAYMHYRPSYNTYTNKWCPHKFTSGRFPCTRPGSAAAVIQWFDLPLGNQYCTLYIHDSVPINCYFFLLSLGNGEEIVRVCWGMCHREVASDAMGNCCKS